MGVMHINEMTNIKSQFETLYKACLKDIVLINSKQLKLEDVLVSAQVNNSYLFFAVEQGVEKFSENINVVLNPKMKCRARK